jgi:4'-phosphopantetheinyl transferase EntD
MRESRQAVAPYNAIDVWNDADGAPRFTVTPRFRIDDRREPRMALNISIAHADGAAVAGVADSDRAGSIGVDIEPTKPLALALLARVLLPAELARLASDGDNPAPLALWTAKEAALKATHSVSAALRDVELSWRSGRYIEARVKRDTTRATRIRVRHREVGPYTIAVALWQ